MSAGFTPGPWVRRDTETHAEIDAETRETLAMVATAEDARLIAAAPDLYEALAALVERGWRAEDIGPDDPEPFDAGRAALAKARGE